MTNLIHSHLFQNLSTWLGIKVLTFEFWSTQALAVDLLKISSFLYSSAFLTGKG